jgi:integrase
MNTTKGVTVYRRKRSPFWYVAYYEPASYDRVHRATEFRTDDTAGKAKAFDLAVELSKRQRVNEGNEAERWEAWVVVYLEQRYRRSPLTLRRYMTSWKYWERFLTANKLAGPRALTFQHVRQFIDWRTGPENQKRVSKKFVSHNTAMTDVKGFQIVMSEAVRRGWIQVNPCRDLGIARDPAKEKREITDEEMERIIAALDTFVAERPHKDWMRISWEIARWQGCRLSETQFDIKRHVNFAENRIMFQGKGGVVVNTRLHQNLKPYLQAMVKSGRTFTCRFPRMGPSAAGAASKFFRQFLDDLGYPDISFHCLRVTVITKLARAGVPVSQAMAFVGHADEEVHRIYQKLKADDLGGVTAALSYTSA